MLGIYVIRNIINNKIYVGSSSNLQKRWTVHKSNLKNNKHHSNILQNAYNKYGIDNFSFEVIEYITDKNILITREQIWLDFFKPEYNVRVIASSSLGIKRSDEFKEKCRQRMLGSTPWNKGLKNTIIPWNKGLSKDNNETVRQYGIKQSITKNKNKS